MFPLLRHDLPPTCRKNDFNQPIYLVFLENRNTDIPAIFSLNFLLNRNGHLPVFAVFAPQYSSEFY